MSDRYIASSVRYGIKDTIKDKFLELEEIADLLNNAEDNGLLVDKKSCWWKMVLSMLKNEKQVAFTALFTDRVQNRQF